MAAHALLSHQLLLHHHLGGDTSVITARVPQGGLTSHPVPEGETQQFKQPRSNVEALALKLSPSGQRVLDGICEGVTQVKRAGHVRRRDAHHEDSPGVLLTDTLPLQKVRVV